MIVSGAFAGKRYAVLGLARSGLAAVETLLASGAHVMAWDAREDARAGLEGRVELADPAISDLSDYDGVVVSPGVPLNRHPIAEAARAAQVPVIGDIELFAMALKTLPPCQVIGITGTNGKSTTTALTTHLLETAGRETRIGGNIGIPILAQPPLLEGGTYVIELSSYQLDLTHTLDCSVAMLLNVSPDHLDRYPDFAAYVASKARLFAMQGVGHLALVDYVAEIEYDVLRSVPEGHSFQFIDSVEIPGDQADWPSLQGPHNRSNAAAAVAAVRWLGVDEATIAQGLRSFHGLPHRMERIARQNGVLFVNDSKATNPASTAPALAAYPRHEHPRIHWICGGLPKGETLDECAPYYCNVRAAYTIGEAGPLFADLLESHVPVKRSEMMSQAIRDAIDASVPGDVILLSPACASFDQFRDYEARGDAFRALVEAFLAEGAAPGEGEPS